MVKTMSTSKSYKPKKLNTSGEMVLFRALDKIISYPYINHGYYSFLKSPRGGNMQLDRYYPDLKLAFEFNGQNHYEYIPFIHKDKEEFEYYQECDALKKKICKELGITLVEIRYNYRIDEDSVKFDIKKQNRGLYEFLFERPF